MGVWRLIGGCCKACRFRKGEWHMIWWTWHQYDLRHVVLAGESARWIEGCVDGVGASCAAGGACDGIVWPQDELVDHMFCCTCIIMESGLSVGYVSEWRFEQKFWSGFQVRNLLWFHCLQRYSWPNHLKCRGTALCWCSWKIARKRSWSLFGTATILVRIWHTLFSK